jgi:PAS domain S-box-containing protein
MTEDSTKRDSSAGFDRDPASESSTKEGPCVCTRPAPDLELFKRMTENAKDMIYRMSLPDGIYEYVSPASIEITGYSPEEFYANPLLIRSLMHPDWRGYFAREWERLLQGDVPPTYEYVILHKDGRERHINQRNVLVREENGTPVALEGILTDVTRNKQSEAALRRSEASYRSLYDSIMDGFAAVSIDGTVQQCNKAFLGMLGYDADEIRHLTYEDFTPEKWHAFERKIIETEVLERGYSDAYEKEYRRKDGNVFPVELRAYLMRDDAGKPAGMWGIVRDITERKKAEERLTRAHRRLENIIEFLPGCHPDYRQRQEVDCLEPGHRRNDGCSQGRNARQGPPRSGRAFYGFAGPYLVDYLDEGAGVDLPRYGNIKRKGDTLNAEAYAPALYNGKGAYIWLSPLRCMTPTAVSSASLNPFATSPSRGVWLKKEKSLKPSWRSPRKWSLSAPWPEVLRTILTTSFRPFSVFANWPWKIFQSRKRQRAPFGKL